MVRSFTMLSCLSAFFAITFAAPLDCPSGIVGQEANDPLFAAEHVSTFTRRDFQVCPDVARRSVELAVRQNCPIDPLIRNPLTESILDQLGARDLLSGLNVTVCPAIGRRLAELVVREDCPTEPTLLHPDIFNVTSLLDRGLSVPEFPICPAIAKRLVVQAASACPTEPTLVNPLLVNALGNLAAIETRDLELEGLKVCPAIARRLEEERKKRGI